MGLFGEKLHRMLNGMSETEGDGTGKGGSPCGNSLDEGPENSRPLGSLNAKRKREDEPQEQNKRGRFGSAFPVFSDTGSFSPTTSAFDNQPCFSQPPVLTGLHAGFETASGVPFNMTESAAPTDTISRRPPSRSINTTTSTAAKMTIEVFEEKLQAEQDKDRLLAAYIATVPGLTDEQRLMTIIALYGLPFAAHGINTASSMAHPNERERAIEILRQWGFDTSKFQRV
ncbi:hypothetical protein PSACC_01625 [Paramicrosporidium saccamoebae]|uniref:Uncharacterized protein n=1 Tax=Paramicrosporidium saccamoebae TaxID=1246581 RepID=A0A2H9TLC1_9FUNG|nr:hypothetical protein PSACC_01625 [Paramicrosporidium saccamoebae]